MRNILLVIDVQNDFVDGALGSKEALSVPARVRDKILAYEKENIFATMDTHFEDYMNTQEGKFLPVMHCIAGTDGRNFHPAVADLLRDVQVFEKSAFGSPALVRTLENIGAQEEIAIEIVGLCTDVCVVTCALMCKAAMPEVPVTVDISCCAGITKEGHAAAVTVMRSCQIRITGE